MPLFVPGDLDADEIVTNLWQGAVPPRGLALRNLGFDLLVLCAREWQLPASDFPSVQVVRAPNDDGPDYSLTSIKLKTAIKASRMVTEAVQANKKCLVTCAAGMNRSGLVTAIALHQLFGWSGKACVEQIRAKRMGSDGYRPLTNPEFVRVLLAIQ